MIYNENDKVLHKDGTELIIIDLASNTIKGELVKREYNDIIYKCFSLITQNIVTINESEIKGFKTPKQE